mmetsp:Transcript_61856/g.134025  ORF Transcript_61856/g.134025 Transcript_61856/m.134025 type:complete len:147 (-) Transcript_61856:94-534(-)
MVSSEVDLKELKKNFEKIDKNGDGVLSFTEIRSGLATMGDYNMEEVEFIFKNMDMDMNGQVEYTEFLAAMMDHRKFDQDDSKILMAFKHLDFDSNGFIDRKEIMKLMGTNNENVVDYILSLVDKNNDGKISFDEFKSLLINESFNK